MLSNRVIVILGVLIFFVPAAIFVPVIVDYSQTSTEEFTYTIDDGDMVTFDRSLELVLDDSTTSQADITLVDTSTGDIETVSIQYGESYTFNFENGDITVYAIEQVDGNTALVSVEYNTPFGWDNDELAINSMMPVIMIAPIAIVFISVIYAAVFPEGDN